MKNQNDQVINLVGVRFREIRKENGWTLGEVSKRTGISKGTLSKLENGKTQLNFSSVNKLASGLQLPVSDLTNLIQLSPINGRLRAHCQEPFLRA